MNLLIDTHVLLWAACDSPKLSKAASDLLLDPASSLFFSPASLWEITIKNALGRKDFQVDPRAFRQGLLENDYVEVPITSLHAINVDMLPPIHKDPFDRILLSQAVQEGLSLVTADRMLAQYSGPVLAV